ncbi:MAG: hypothetical protein ACLR2O_04555 [Coprococcus sp.]
MQIPAQLRHAPDLRMPATRSSCREAEGGVKGGDYSCGVMLIVTPYGRMLRLSVHEEI